MHILLKDSLQKVKQRLSPHSYLLRTWTGRILIINTLVFVLITIVSGELFNPSPLYLIAAGAKDPLSIGLGQWWRFITPVFLHIGLLHFVLNSLALKFVGRIVEPMLGGRWFLLIYFLSGIAGNIFSSLDSVAIGAGASGAIFGLIGVGVVLEILAENHRVRTASQLKRRLIPGPFCFMALLNIALAVILNFFLSLSAGANIGIDNAAHLGGLGTGCLLGFAFLLSKPNPIVKLAKKTSFLLATACVLSLFGLGVFASQSEQIKRLYIEDALASKDFWPAVVSYSRALELAPEDPALRLQRAELLLRAGKYEAEALDDLRHALKNPLLRPQIVSLQEDLQRLGDERAAFLIQQLLQQTSGAAL